MNVRCTYPLKHLLPPNILQSSIQILNLAHNILHLPLILTFNLARLPDRHVEIDANAAGRSTVQPPASGNMRVRGETDLVQARVGGGKSEAAGVTVALVDDAVVVVEGFVDGDLHAQAGIGAVHVCLGV